MSIANPSLNAHITKLKAMIVNKRAELAGIESELAELYRAQENVESTNTLWAEQQRHLGAIRFYLERVPQATQDLSMIEQKIVESRQKVAQLEEQLSTFDVEDRLQSALGILAQTMTALSKNLNLEKPDSGLRLDIKRLTVIRDSPTGKPERLNEIGSGANWVGYHLCALLALHIFFIRLNSIVPAFLFIDQPSQVYFPEEKREPFQGRQDSRTDWEAVRQMYRMIFDTVQSLDNRLQIIILDYADLQDDRFKKYVRVRWRDGMTLI